MSVIKFPGPKQRRIALPQMEQSGNNLVKLEPEQELAGAIVVYPKKPIPLQAKLGIGIWCNPLAVQMFINKEKLYDELRSHLGLYSCNLWHCFPCDANWLSFAFPIHRKEDLSSGVACGIQACVKIGITAMSAPLPLHIIGQSILPRQMHHLL